MANSQQIELKLGQALKVCSHLYKPKSATNRHSRQASLLLNGIFGFRSQCLLQCLLCSRISTKPSVSAAVPGGDADRAGTPRGLYSDVLDRLDPRATSAAASSILGSKLRFLDKS